MRLALISACQLLGLAVAGAAAAGDAATLDILGFSSDGAIFAFEEYGIQDGSGFPYANRFYINTSDDLFVRGSPFRMRGHDETATVSQMRNNARAKGEAIIEDRELREHAGRTVGYQALTQLGVDPHQIEVRPRAVFPPIDKPITFQITQETVAAPSTCAGVVEEAASFQLTMSVEGGPSRILHDDNGNVPASRGCPLGYSIQAVQTYYPDQGDPAVAVLIAVERVGFEGPDHRFIAIAGKL